MNTVRPRLRIGLMLRDPQPAEWVHSLVEQLCAAGHLDVAAVVFCGRARARRSLPLLLRLWLRFERWYFGEAPTPARELKTGLVERLSLITVRKGDTGREYTSALSRMRALDLDVLVQLENEEMPEEILDCARYGVWTLRYVGHPAVDAEQGLLSILYRRGRTCELVLRSHCGGSRRYTLYRSSFQTHAVSLHKNLILDQQRRSQVLLRRLFDLFDRGWNSIAIDEHESEPAERLKGQITGALFLARWLVRCLRHLLSKLWFEEQWIIALSRERDSLMLPRRRSRHGLSIMAPLPGRNHADPFLFAHSGKTYIFFEHWQAGRRGSIYCAELGRDGFPTAPRQVLARDYHLSYPFVFEWNGEPYMLAETQQNNTVEAYRAIDFPWKWERAGILLSNVVAADPTIFEHKGKLWLFVAGIGGSATNTSELSLFFSDSLFGEWRPHPANPIVCDVRRARPAGALFTEGGVLIRPGQDCSGRYGCAITLNRVEVLSETEYREVPFATIRPNWMPGICATHTMNRTAGFEVLDAVTRRPRYASLARRDSAA